MRDDCLLYINPIKFSISLLVKFRSFYASGGDASAAREGLKLQQQKSGGSSSGKNNKSSDPSKVMVNGKEYKTYAEPDVSSYTYDETSGYYYDST